MMISEDNVRKIIREELIRLMEQDEGKSPSLNDLEFMSDERVDLERWASRHGHMTTKVMSVLIDYLVHQKLEGAKELQKKLAKELGFDQKDIDAALEGKLRNEADPETEENARVLNLSQVVEAISKL